MKKFLLSLLTTALFGGNVMANEVLTPREQAIVLASSYTARENLSALKQALIKGFDEGVSVNEFKEILVQSYAYCGFPRALNALSVLMQTENERENKDEIGKEPSNKPQGDALVYGAENQTKLVGAEVKGKIFEFAPAIDEYLKSHLFGDIFSRDNIDWKTREIATVAMLAAREGAESQLQAHINIAKHNGVTDEQIEEILKLASKTKVDDIIFGFGEENPYSQYFTGKSYLKPITTENGVPMYNVTFEPGCRNNWHIHHGSGQILLVTEGRGWYQAWGEEPRELKKGDVVNIPAETKHWHGAAKDSWFNHIAVEVPGTNNSNEWLEPVSNEDYNKLK